MVPSNESAEEIFEQLEHARAAVLASSGYPVLVELQRLSSMSRMFLGNHRELHQALGRMRDPDTWLPMWDIRHRDRLELFLAEIDRLLHNYLAGSYSLSASIRELARRLLRGRSEFSEYEGANPYTAEGLPALMFSLRHVSQHQQVVSIVNQLAIGRSSTADGPLSATPTILVIRSELLGFDWSSSAQKKAGLAYLESLDDDPDLGDLVESFTRRLLGFEHQVHRWVRSAHRDRLEELQVLLQRQAKLAAPIAEAMRNWGP